MAEVQANQKPGQNESGGIEEETAFLISNPVQFESCGNEGSISTIDIITEFKWLTIQREMSRRIDAWPSKLPTREKTHHDSLVKCRE